MAMNFDDLIAMINPDIAERLKTAIETGRWPDGNRLTEEQMESCIQAVMAYEAKHTSSDSNEPFKVNQAGKFKLGKESTGKQDKGLKAGLIARSKL